MREVPVAEAKNKFTALLSEVEGGAEIVITRRGHPVARLVAADPGLRQDRAQRAADGLRTLGQQLTLGSDLAIADLVREGRR